MSHTKTKSNFCKVENRQAIDSYDDSEKVCMAIQNLRVSG